MFDSDAVGACRQRAEQLELERMVILEIGGGDGRLSAHLQVGLAATCPAAGVCAIELCCSDSGSNALHASSPFRQLPQLISFTALLRLRPLSFDLLMCRLHSQRPSSPEGLLTSLMCGRNRGCNIVGLCNLVVMCNPKMTVHVVTKQTVL